MAGKRAVLASRILSELADLEGVVERVEQAWGQGTATADNLYFDSAALNMHSFYSGLEKLFEKIAISIDCSLPEGANWHQELLNQMSLQIKNVRPAVISDKLKDNLESYRGFRHVVRNVYSYRISADKMRPLAKKIRTVYSQVDRELSTFADFLQSH